jgi:hypothetical protein
MLFPIPKFSPAVAFVLELRYMTSQTCDNLWPFGKKKEVVSIQVPVPRLQFANQWGIPASTFALLSFFPQWYISTLYVLCFKEIVKKNKCHENTSKFLILWVHYLHCLKTRQLRNTTVVRILQSASVYGYMISVFLCNSTFTSSQIYLNSLRCILNCLQ